MNVSEELARLAQLRNDGVLTEEEFQAQKAAVLAGGSAATPAAVPVKPKPPKGKAALGCLALIAVIVVILIAIGASGDGGTANEHTAPASATPPTEVSATDLARAYEANEAAAQQQYGSGPLLVSGTIDAIDLDFADKPVVRLKTANQFMGANANLTEASQAKAGTLSKGTAIKLLCGGVGEVMGSPQLKDCEIQ